MKKFFLIVGAVLIVSAALAILSVAQGPKRFVQLQYETVSGSTYIHHFETWHDAETGQEITCIFSSHDYGPKMSCFPTGRSWK